MVGFARVAGIFFRWVMEFGEKKSSADSDILILIHEGWWIEENRGSHSR